MNNLEKAKEIVRENYKFANCGIFDSRNLVGDEMGTLYDDGELTIDICYGYAYFEVFGLNDADFKKLVDFYESLSESEE